MLNYTLKVSTNIFLKATGGAQGFSVDMDTVRAFHAFNKDKKEAYLLMRFSDDGKKVIFEKGPAKKKPTAKSTYAERSMSMKFYFSEFNTNFLTN